MAARHGEAVAWIRRTNNTSDASPLLHAPEPPFSGEDAGTSANKKMRKAVARPPEARTKFRGVHRRRRSGKYAARIGNSNREARTWLGTFDTPEDAARAYDAAAVKLHGAAAITNFEQPPTSAAVLAGVGVESPMDDLSDFPELLARNLFSDGGQLDDLQADVSDDLPVEFPELLPLNLFSDSIGGPGAQIAEPQVAERAVKKNTAARTEGVRRRGVAAAAQLHGAAASKKTKLEVDEGVDVQAAAAPAGFRGVSQTRSGGKYRARIWNPLQRSEQYLGTFDKAEDAAGVYDAEAVRLLGDRAITNFKLPGMDLSNGDWPQAEELQWVDELLQDMDFSDVPAS